VGEVQAGRELTRALVERHGRPLRQYLRACTGSLELAEDLAQEVYLRVLRGAERYEDRERERAWLFRIARNAVTDYRRRVATRPVTTARLAEPAQSPQQSLSVELRHALSSLSDFEREAFLMAELGGLSYAEISAALGSTVPAVRSSLYRARLSLRAMLMPPAPMAQPLRGTRDDT